MILSEDTVVAAVECKHVIVQSLDEVKGTYFLVTFWRPSLGIICMTFDKV